MTRFLRNPVKAQESRAAKAALNKQHITTIGNTLKMIEYAYFSFLKQHFRYRYVLQSANSIGPYKLPAPSNSFATPESIRLSYQALKGLRGRSAYPPPYLVD